MFRRHQSLYVPSAAATTSALVPLIGIGTRIELTSSGRLGSGLEDEDRGVARPQRGVLVEILVVMSPALPQAVSFVSDRRPGTDGARSIDEFDGGVWMRL